MQAARPPEDHPLTFKEHGLTTTLPRLDLSSLDWTMRSADEGTVLVPPWLLRSVILADSPGRWTTLAIPRGRCLGIGRERLVAIIEQRDLPLVLPPIHAPEVVLLAAPDEEWLTATPIEEVLREYWALLYHARIHLGMRTCLAGEQTSEVQERIERIGPAAFNDARFVLLRERMLPPGAADAEAYARFAAAFLEMTSFAPVLRERYFAAVDDPARVLQTLRADVDADALLARTRPEGADGPSPPEPTRAPKSPPPTEETDRPPEPLQRRGLQRRITRAAALGNDVRAAILHQRAVQPPQRGGHLPDARDNPHFARFLERLAAALRLENANEWAAALTPVLVRASDGWRNAESRILYDLQTVCTDSEREVYTLDALGWLLTLGRRPLRRAVPAQRIVLVCKRLRSALGRLGRCRLEPEPRRRLDDLLRAAVRRSEHHVRQQLRPCISNALDRGRLQPRHAVEQVAREKLIEEFLDGIVRQGFARIGDLRDALSRNQLELHDLGGAGRWFTATSFCRSTGTWPSPWMASTTPARRTCASSRDSVRCCSPHPWGGCLPTTR